MDAKELPVESRKRKFDGVAHLFYYWSDSRPDGKIWVGGTNDTDEKMRRDREAFKRYKTGQGKWQPCFQLVQFPDVQASILETFTDLSHDMKKAREELEGSRDRALSVFEMDTAGDHEDEDEKMDDEEAMKHKKPKRSNAHAHVAQDDRKEYVWKIGPCPWPGCDRLIKDHPERHKWTHTGEKPYACDSDGCGAAFADPGALKRHKRTHTGDKPYVCDVPECKSAFSDRSGLRKHRMVHTREKPFVCDVDGCKAAFAAKGGLKTHKRRHTGDKPYVCDWEGCNARFVESGDLKKHKRVHTGDKPYVCDFDGCGVAVASSGNLKTHKRIHTREKPFVCDVDGCKAAFAAKGRLKNS